MSLKVKRLYKDLKPSHYDVSIKFDIPKMTFKGRVELQAKVTKRPSKRITLHLKDLKVLKAQVFILQNKQKKEIKVERINTHNRYQELRLHFDKLIYAGDYLIVIDYEGKINDSLNGIYPSYYKDKKELIILTQFESHYAREALPCVDEPEAKATFKLKLETNHKFNSYISNTPIESQIKGVNKDTVLFEITPKMSTYLLSFVFGNLDFNETITKDQKKIRVYSIMGKKEDTLFALEVARKTLEFYESYFDIKYPLSKCDFIAIPDFASGAMENWGCITFREQALLINKNESSLYMKQYVANVIAHELTHQWFGNLVTMKWWTDLWLNESFASFMSYVAVDNLFPDWKVWKSFIIEEQFVAMSLDQLNNTHPIQVEINHPDEIKTIFDNISYEKGAAIIMMLEDFLGSKTFMAGIRKYLKRNEYSNTLTTDLWQSLSEVSDKNILDFMGSWTSLSGFPEVKVIKHGDNIHFSQKRFLLDRIKETTDNNWPVPINSSFYDLNLLLRSKEANLKIEDSNNPVLINKGHRSFYRVNYDNQIIKDVKDYGLIKLDLLDRVGFLSDIFEISKTNEISIVTYLDLIKDLSDLTDLEDWQLIAGSLNTIKVVFNDQDLFEKMSPFIESLISKQLKRLGFKSKSKDTIFDTLLRPLILAMAVRSFNQDFKDYASEMFKKDPSLVNVSPEIRPVIYAQISKNNNPEDYDKLIKLHEESNNPEVKNYLLGSITDFKDQKLIDKTINYLKSDKIRSQDIHYWISHLFLNDQAKDKIWLWLKDNWSNLKLMTGEDLSFYRTPIYVARFYSNKAFKKEFVYFFKSVMTPSLERSFKQALEILDWQSNWKENDLDKIKKYFK